MGFKPWWSGSRVRVLICDAMQPQRLSDCTGAHSARAGQFLCSPGHLEDDEMGIPLGDIQPSLDHSRLGQASAPPEASPTFPRDSRRSPYSLQSPHSINGVKQEVVSVWAC